jgi:hypothetical protein
MTRKQRYWKKHITAWQDSGLSQAAYCRDHGLSIKVFGYHKRKLASVCEVQEVIPVPHSAVPLIPNVICNRPIKLYVRDNLRLDIEPGFCQQTLKRILKVVGA